MSYLGRYCGRRKKLYTIIFPPCVFLQQCKTNNSGNNQYICGNPFPVKVFLEYNLGQYHNKHHRQRINDNAKPVIDFCIYKYVKRQNTNIAYIRYNDIRIQVFKKDALMLPVCAFF